jgi:hypothetical protein
MCTCNWYKVDNSVAYQAAELQHLHMSLYTKAGQLLKRCYPVCYMDHRRLAQTPAQKSAWSQTRSIRGAATPVLTVLVLLSGLMIRWLTGAPLRAVGPAPKLGRGALLRGRGLGLPLALVGSAAAPPDAGGPRPSAAADA